MLGLDTQSYIVQSRKTKLKNPEITNHLNTQLISKISVSIRISISKHKYTTMNIHTNIIHRTKTSIKIHSYT